MSNITLGQMYLKELEAEAGHFAEAGAAPLGWVASADALASVASAISSQSAVTARSDCPRPCSHSAKFCSSSAGSSGSSRRIAAAARIAARRSPMPSGR